MTEKLIACVLGGTASRAKTELHDVAFAVGASLDDVHEQLLDAWFGDPRGLHVDAWAVLEHVAGYRIRLRRTPVDNGLHLYFVNLGGYRRGEFGERHAWGFFGARSKAEAKTRARQTLLNGHEQRHKDDLYDIDNCLPINNVRGWHVRLDADSRAGEPLVTNGYFPLPPKTIASWRAKRTLAGRK